ncbi:hypothetical protein BH23ACT11_BH23ACT11_25180 [soil metagenome]
MGDNADDEIQIVATYFAVVPPVFAIGVYFCLIPLLTLAHVAIVC